jgi:hypothetical protein
MCEVARGHRLHKHRWAVDNMDHTPRRRRWRFTGFQMKDVQEMAVLPDRSRGGIDDGDPRRAPMPRYVAAYDPRRQPRLSERDVRGLLFIGRGYEVAQYQLHEAIFPGLAECIPSRWAQRMAKRGAIAIERWAKVGINRLRLTKAGLELLAAHGVNVDDVFTPRQATALKDVQHTLWINDLRVVLPSLSMPLDVIAPAWLLQRQLGASAAAIPDVLAIRRPREGERGFVLAVEIDLGAERLKSVFLPKLARLQVATVDWSVDAAAAVLVLTRGRGRVAALRDALEESELPILVRELPHDCGRPGLRQLAAALREAV